MSDTLSIVNTPGGDAARHLELMFSGLPDGYLATIFQLPSKHTTRHAGSGHAEMARSALAIREFGDTYCGVYAVQAPGPKKGRGGSMDCAALVGLWVDIDIHHDQDKTAGHPPTLEDGMSLIDAAPVPPSLVVWSGYGLQPFWLFDTPWILPDADARAAATALAHDWVAIFQRVATAKGWSVDHCKDIARVLRIAGTINHKHDTQSETKLLRADGRAYTARELRDAAPRSSAVPTAFLGGPSIALGDFSTTDDDGVNAGRLSIMLENNDDFKATYDGKRSYQSDSERDMALANFCAAAEWPPAEIACLLLSTRRQRGLDLKHHGYYVATVSKAFESAIAQRAKRQVTGEEAGDASDEDTLSKALGVPIARRIRYGTENSTYAVTLVSDGHEHEVMLGTIAEMLGSLSVFRARIADATGSLPFSAWKKHEIEAWINGLIRGAELRELGISAQSDLQEWLQDYIAAPETMAQQAEEHDGAPASSYLDAAGAAKLRAIRNERIRHCTPYLEDGRWHINVQAFGSWIGQRVKLTDSELATRLRVAGWATVTLQGRIDGKKIGRRFWQSPQSWSLGGDE